MGVLVELALVLVDLALVLVELALVLVQLAILMLKEISFTPLPQPELDTDTTHPTWCTEPDTEPTLSPRGQCLPTPGCNYSDVSMDPCKYTTLPCTEAVRLKAAQAAQAGLI